MHAGGDRSAAGAVLRRRAQDEGALFAHRDFHSPPEPLPRRPPEPDGLSGPSVCVCVCVCVCIHKYIHTYE